MKTIIRIAAIAVVTLTIASCGGGGGGTTTRAGSLRLTVNWPPPSRLIPLACNSINAVLTYQGQTIGSQLLPRPANGTQTSVTFNNVPAGGNTLACTAYPNANGTGVAQATGSAPANIVAGRTASVTVTMASTIDHLTITPANPTITVGATQQLTMTAYDVAGNIVLTAPQNVSWSSVTTSKATIDQATGLVTAVAAGTSQITVTESESQKSANTLVTVTAQQGGCTPGDVTGAVGTVGPFASFGGNFMHWNQSPYNPLQTNTVVTLQTGTGGAAAPALGADGTIYICSSSDQKLIAVDPTTYQIKWSFTAPDGGIGSTPTIGTDGHIYIASNMSVYALDMNGNQLWTRQSTGPSSITLGKDGTVYYTTTGGTLALDPANGNIKWNNGNARNTGWPYINPATDSHGHLILGGLTQSTQNLYSVDGKCGSILWSTPLVANAVTVGPDDTIYACADYGPSFVTRMVALDGTTGQIKWSTNVDVQNSPPALNTTTGKLYVVGPHGTVSALDSVTGHLDWTFAVPNALANTPMSFGAPTIAADGTVIFVARWGDQQNNRMSSVYYLNPADGSLIIARNLTGNQPYADVSTPVIDSHGQTIVRDDNTGTVYFFK